MLGRMKPSSWDARDLSYILGPTYHTLLHSLRSLGMLAPTQLDERSEDISQGWEVLAAGFTACSSIPG